MSSTFPPATLRLATSLVLALLALPLTAEEPPPQATSSFGDTLDVQLVNVEVWVTDKKRRPITGLTAADFAVREDGEPVEITHFSENRGGRGPESAIAPLAPAAAAPELPAIAADPGHLVLFFDESNLSPMSRKRSVASLERFMADNNVPPQRVMILRGADNLATAASFDSTADELAAALAEVARTRHAGARAISEKLETQKQLEITWQSVRNMRDPCRTFVPSAHFEIENYATRRRQNALTAIDHLRMVSSFLAGVPGVKTLVFISDALETAPGDDLLVFVNHHCPLPAQDDPKVTLGELLSEPLRQLTRHANANRVTFYTWQATGLRTDPLGSAASNSRPVPTLAARMRTSDRDGLSYLAVDTGGRLLTNRNNFRGELESVARDMSTYYSLAYVPRHGGDGGEHTIDVDVGRIDGRKVEVRHRLGYRDKSPDERMSEKLQSALYLGRVANPLAARLAAGTVRPADDGGFVVPLHVLVPSGELVFLPQDDGEVAHLKVKVASRRTDDGKVTFDERAVSTRRPAEETVLAIPFPLALAEGIHVVAVGLRDEATRETSYVTTAVEILDPAGDAARQ